MYTLKQIPSEAHIKKFIRRTLFGKNMFCPECKSRSVLRSKERYRCRNCRCRFSLLSHTWLSHMRIPLTQFWLVLWCWTCAVPIKQTTALAGMTDKSVRRWFGLFRAHLPAETHILERIVQMDEAYFKGKTLVMAKQTGTRRLAFEIVNGTSVQRHHAGYFLFRKVRPGSQLWTDGAGIYQGIDSWWPVEHHRDIHRKFEFEHTSEIEGIFGNYRTFVRRMYHHHRSENLPEYVREFCFRFSSPELFKDPKFFLTKTLKLVTLAT